MKYSDVKDDLDKEHISGNKKLYVDSGITEFEYRLLRVLNAIAGELDSIAYAARCLTKVPQGRKRK
jgi:hypothetical protein